MNRKQKKQNNFLPLVGLLCLVCFICWTFFSIGADIGKKNKKAILTGKPEEMQILYAHYSLLDKAINEADTLQIIISLGHIKVMANNIHNKYDN